MTIRELVAALGVTTTAIRLQVDRLVGDGVLAVQKRGGRRGRPSDVFRLTEHGWSLVRHQYDRFLELLLAELADQEGVERVAELVGRVALRLADSYAERITGATMEERLTSWTELLREQDILAEVQQVDRLVVVRQCGCPYYRLARISQWFCSVHIQVLNHLMDGRVRRTRCVAEGDTHCEFEAESNRQGAPQGAG
jgi:predicted ArsR family transcriptional regulator